MQFFAPYVWLYRPEDKALIIKLEEFEKPIYLCVNASFARDGSGPLLASFMSMLLIEDSHATMTGQIGICSGRASVTIYHCLDVTHWCAKRLTNYLINFEKLTLCILLILFDAKCVPPSGNVTTSSKLKAGELNFLSFDLYKGWLIPFSLTSILFAIPI